MAQLTLQSLQAVALDISKAFDRVCWSTGLLQKLKSYWISGQVFGLISFFLSNRQLWVVLDGKSTTLEFLKAPFLVLNFSYYTLMTFLMILSVILHLCWWYYSLLLVWSDIWSVATTRIGFQLRIWYTGHCELGQGVACWFQCWKNSTGFTWLV